MKVNTRVLVNVLSDLLSASMSWCVFFYFRKTVIESEKFGKLLNIDFDDYFFISLVSVSFFWLVLYLITGTYKNVYRKSRLNEFGQTLLISLIGSLVIFFALILDDTIVNFKSYYRSFAVLFVSHASITSVIRYILSTQIARKIRKREITFNTIIIGSNENALELLTEMRENKHSNGEHFIGYISVLENTKDLLAKELPCLGDYTELHQILNSNEIVDVIIAIESSEHGKLQEILTIINGSKVTVKVIPDMYDILSGSVKMSTIFGTPLIEVTPNLMPTWQFVLKRFIDLFVSLFCLSVLSPLYVFTFIMVKLSSPGPVFFKQERIGLGGKPFNILKFRSMYVDAEKEGPALSSDDDPRITKWGKVMRKYRLDELPQFFNVLKGEMSLVGPRPERQYYINLILEKAPHYKHLLKVQPGITSWGMVKYGYASNIDEMIKRMKFDLLYIENMSLMTDFKILIYTVLIVLQGRGK